MKKFVLILSLAATFSVAPTVSAETGWFGIECSKSYRWGCKTNPR
jgi:hypothetical protein